MKPWSSRTLHSEKNGKVVIKRRFGKSEIEVDGFVQSGDYMRCLWSEALWRANSNPRIESVLMLGLGCGSAITVVLRRFPGCDVTIVEWDPLMITLAMDLAWFKPNPHLTILCGDAVEILPNLTQRFDLILCDLFKGDVLEARLADQSVVSSLAQVMTPNGQLIVNGFKDGHVFESLGKQLDCVRRWRFRNNELALFQLLIPKNLSCR